MSEEDDIRKRKMEELKQQYAQQNSEEHRQLEAESQLSAVLRKVLTDEARARLNNVKLVNKDLYLRVSQALLYFVQANRLQGKMGDAELKDLLSKMSAKKEINIKRK
ncbi:MAG: DNA-binding protein [Candidatus Diapherotrites archaeon]